MWLYLSDGSFSMGLGALLLTVLGIYWLWLEWIDYINPQPYFEIRRRERGRHAQGHRECGASSDPGFRIADPAMKGLVLLLRPGPPQ
jgi:hypothetical protein